jgi:hypothetical protein
MTITPNQLLESTDIGCGFHLWRCEGGIMRVTREELEPILREAYDPTFPSWPSPVSWDEWEGWHVA